MLRAGWLWSGSLAAALGPELTLPRPCPAGSEGAALLSELPAPAGTPAEGRTAGVHLGGPCGLGPLERGTGRSLRPAEVSLHHAPPPMLAQGPSKPNFSLSVTRPSFREGFSQRPQPGPAGVISQELSGPAKVTLCTARGAISGDPSLGAPVPVTLRGSLGGDSPGDVQTRLRGSWGRAGGRTASSFPPPMSLSLAPVYAAALTLQQTPLGQRLRQKRSKPALTQPWREGAGEAASAHWDG